MMKKIKDALQGIAYGAALGFGLLNGIYLFVPEVRAQINNPGVPVSGAPANNDCAKFVVSGGNVQSITTTGANCSPAVSAANPTATASDVAVNGVAATYMRSDAAPAVQKGTNVLFGVIRGDGSTVNCTAGVCVVAGIVVGGQTITPGGTATVQGNGAKIQLSTGTATSGDCVKFDANGNTIANGAACATQSVGANPTATAGPAAVNGVATTFMRSDAAPLIQKGTNAQFGIVEGDGTTVTCVLGVCSAVGVGANPTATAGPAAVNGVATTFMRSDAAPLIQKGTNAQFGIVEGDGTTVTCVLGVCSAVGVGANPTATAGPTAINGAATTFMRSDAAPAIQKASNAQFGIMEGDGTTISCVAGVCSAPAGSGTVTNVATAGLATGGPITTTGTITVTAATQADQETSTSTTTAVVPGRQQFHPSAAKAWCRWNGTTAGTNACIAGYNVTNVTRTAAGDYNVNIATAFSATTAIACVVTARSGTPSTGAPLAQFDITSTTVIRAVSFNISGTALGDADFMYLVCFGDQ